MESGVSEIKRKVRLKLFDLKLAARLSLVSHKNQHLPVY